MVSVTTTNTSRCVVLKLLFCFVFNMSTWHLVVSVEHSLIYFNLFCVFRFIFFTDWKTQFCYWSKTDTWLVCHFQKQVRAVALMCCYGLSGKLLLSPAFPKLLPSSSSGLQGRARLHEPLVCTPSLTEMKWGNGHSELDHWNMALERP